MLTFELENDSAAMEPRRNLAPRFSGTGSTRLLYLQIKYHPMVMCQMCFFHVIHSFCSSFLQATSILPLPLKYYLSSPLYLKILLLGQNEQLVKMCSFLKKKNTKVFPYTSKLTHGEFPGSPGVRTPHSNSWEWGFCPWLGNEDPKSQAAQPPPTTTYNWHTQLE